MRRHLTALAAALVAAALIVSAAGCARTPAPAGAGTVHPLRSAAGAPAIAVSSVSPYGRILTTGEGYALYVFAPDRASRVTCSGSCLDTWPAVYVDGTLQSMAGPGVRRSLLGTSPDANGRPVVTYDGWPLYTYEADSGPGFVSGQDLNIDGGLWWVIAPDGTPIRTG